jgi:hypothetical protein
MASANPMALTGPADFAMGGFSVRQQEIPRAGFPSSFHQDH